MTWTCADIAIRLPNSNGHLQAADFGQLVSHLDGLHLINLPFSLTGNPSIPTHFQRASVQEAWRCLSEMANAHSALPAHFSLRLRDQLHTLREIQDFYQGAPVDLHTLAGDLSDIRSVRSIRGTNNDIPHSLEYFNTSLLAVNDILNLATPPPALVVASPTPPVAPTMPAPVQPSPPHQTSPTPVREERAPVVERQVIVEVHHFSSDPKRHDVGFVFVVLGALAVYRLSSQKSRLRREAVRNREVERSQRDLHMDQGARIIRERDAASGRAKEFEERCAALTIANKSLAETVALANAELGARPAEVSKADRSGVDQETLESLNVDILATRVRGLDMALGSAITFFQSAGGQYDTIKKEIEEITRRLNLAKELLVLLMDIQSAYAEIDEFIAAEDLPVGQYIKFYQLTKEVNLVEDIFATRENSKRLDLSSRVKTAINLMENAELKIEGINADLPKGERFSFPQSRLELGSLMQRCLEMIGGIKLEPLLNITEALSDSLKQAEERLAKERPIIPIPTL